jgi:hypothetical protein
MRSNRISQRHGPVQRPQRAERRHRQQWCIYTTMLLNYDKSGAQFQLSNDRRCAFEEKAFDSYPLVRIT